MAWVRAYACRVMAALAPSQQTRDIKPMLGQCLADVVDGGPTLYQQWFNVSCFLGARTNSRPPKLTHSTSHSGVRSLDVYSRIYTVAPWTDPQLTHPTHKSLQQTDHCPIEHYPSCSFTG